MFAIVCQFFDIVLEGLVMFLFLAICASLIARVLTSLSLVFYHASRHAFEAFHVRGMHTFLALLQFAVLLLDFLLGF